MPVIDSPEYLLGKKCFTIGYPLTPIQGFDPKFTEGSISSLSGIDDDPSMLQISVPIQLGNSGGALVSETGEVLGIVHAQLDSAVTFEVAGGLPQNVNYAIKTGPLLKLLGEAELQAAHKPEGVDREAAIASAQAATVRIVTYSYR